MDAEGEPMICLYDDYDPSAARVVVSETGLLLASLLDGHRTMAAVREDFERRIGADVPQAEIADFVLQLDRANLLDSERYRARLRTTVAEFRASPSRPSAHAGGAYPAVQWKLRRFLDACWTRTGGPGAAPGPAARPGLRGLFVPHIDLQRGGHSYAWGYRELAEREPADLYVLLGTCHRPMGTPFAATSKPYDTPLGTVPTDLDFLDRLGRRAPYDIYTDEYSHRAEHSLEFQAVYLRYLAHAPTASIVPILCVPPTDLREGATPPESAMAGDMLAALRETIQEDGRRICMIVGADFAHIGPQFGDPAEVDASFARRVAGGDQAMLELAARGDAEGFYRQVVDERPGTGMAGEAGAVGGPRRVCGLAPMYAALWLLGPSEGRVLHYDQWIDPRGTGAVTFGCLAFP